MIKWLFVGFYTNYAHSLILIESEYEKNDLKHKVQEIPPQMPMRKNH
jgi:hypothetical protein